VNELWHAGRFCEILFISLFVEHKNHEQHCCHPLFSKAQGNRCDSADLFCQTSSYPGNVSGGNAEPGAWYGCLETQPNPSWFYMKVLGSGSFIITIESYPLQDIDFACWGPFTSPVSPCVEGLTQSNMIDCSYSPHATEICSIPNGITGEYYILLTTKYSNQPCDVKLSQTGGSGTPDCFPTSVETTGIGNKVVSQWNFPNPFNTKTTLVFSVPNTTCAKLEIFDVNGRHLTTLFEGTAINNRVYSIDYDGTDNPLGILIYRLTTHESVFTGKMMHVN